MKVRSGELGDAEMPGARRRHVVRTRHPPRAFRADERVPAWDPRIHLESDDLAILLHAGGAGQSRRSFGSLALRLIDKATSLQFNATILLAAGIEIFCLLQRFSGPQSGVPKSDGFLPRCHKLLLQIDDQRPDFELPWVFGPGRLWLYQLTQLFYRDSCHVERGEPLLGDIEASLNGGEIKFHWVNLQKNRDANLIHSKCARAA